MSDHFGLGISLAGEGYQKRIGIWDTWYRGLTELAVLTTIGVFIAGGMTAATFIGLILTVVLWTIAVFLAGIAGLICFLGVLINFLSGK